MTTFLLTPAAAQDLTEIAEFIAQDSPRAAVRLIDSLQTAMENLALMPYAGHRRDDLADETLRVRAVHRYLIVYRPDQRPIEIIRVLHGARDIASLLGG